MADDDDYAATTAHTLNRETIARYRMALESIRIVCQCAHPTGPSGAGIINLINKALNENQGECSG